MKNCRLHRRFNMKSPRSEHAVLCWTVCMLMHCANALAQPQVQTERTIHWYVADFSYLPTSIVKDVQQGFVDIVLNKELIPQLKTFSQTVDVVPMPRRNAMLEGQDPFACAPGILRTTDREKLQLFSRPYLATHAQGAMVRKRQLPTLQPYIEKSGALDLTQLLSDSKFIVGIASGRSYGEFIDGILSSQRSNPALHTISTARPTENLLAMLRLGRIDLTIAFPFESEEALGDGDQAENKLVYLPLLGQARYILFQASCANSPEGRQAIEAIDKIAGGAGMRNTVANYYQHLLPGNLQKDSIRLRRQATADGKFK